MMIASRIIRRRYDMIFRGLGTIALVLGTLIALPLGVVCIWVASKI